ncbi:hypothetical protein G9A89_011487 [Geosiphon pyriformis]|nr:hypothetical protein G9A89_011487 [Geosiphon pyriformis]
MTYRRIDEKRNLSTREQITASSIEDREPTPSTVLQKRASESQESQTHVPNWKKFLSLANYNSNVSNTSSQNNPEVNSSPKTKKDVGQVKKQSSVNPDTETSNKKRNETKTDDASLDSGQELLQRNNKKRRLSDHGEDKNLTESSSLKAKVPKSRIHRHLTGDPDVDNQKPEKSTNHNKTEKNNPKITHKKKKRKAAVEGKPAIELEHDDRQVKDAGSDQTSMDPSLLEKIPETANDSTKAGALKYVNLLALQYLIQWRMNRMSTWKFQKVRQIWLLQHVYDPTMVPKEFFKIFIEYITNLTGKARQKTFKEAQEIVDSGDKFLNQVSQDEKPQDENGKDLRTKKLIGQNDGKVSTHSTTEKKQNEIKGQRAMKILSVLS